MYQNRHPKSNPTGHNKRLLAFFLRYNAALKILGSVGGAMGVQPEIVRDEMLVRSRCESARTRHLRKRRHGANMSKHRRANHSHQQTSDFAECFSRCHGFFPFSACQTHIIHFIRGHPHHFSDASSPPARTRSFSRPESAAVAETVLPPARIATLPSPLTAALMSVNSSRSPDAIAS